MRFRMLAGLALTTVLPVAMIGCASATNATDSTISYLHGDQHAKLGAPPPQIVEATVAAAKELDLPVDSKSADGLVGQVLMHNADGTKVEVSIKGEVNDQSEVTVRVGTFGDKTLQARVLDKIKAHLTTGVSASAVSSAPVTNAAPATAAVEPANPLAATPTATTTMPATMP